MKEKEHEETLCRCPKGLYLTRSALKALEDAWEEKGRLLSPVEVKMLLPEQFGSK